MSHIYEVTAPDGKTYTLTGPDNATQDQLLAEVIKQNPLAGKKAITTSEAPKYNASFGENFEAGIGSAEKGLVRGVQQLGTETAAAIEKRVTGKVSPKTRADLETQQKAIDEQEKIDRPLNKTAGGKLGRFAAEAVPAAAASLIPGVNTVAGSAVLGGAMGAVQPTASGESRTLNTLIGAGAGAIGQGGAKTLSKVIAPKIGQEARDLLQNGVRLTPGQIAGGAAKTVEEGAKSIPGVGQMVSNAEMRAVQDFNIATVNKALQPIGVRLPQGTKAGHEAIEAGQKALSSAYDQLLPNLSWTMDRGFVGDIKSLMKTVSEMPPAQQQQFKTFVKNRLGDRLQQNAVLNGAEFKDIQSQFTAEARGYQGDPDRANRKLGEALGAVGDAMRSTLGRLNPKYAPQLDKIDKAYAMFTRVENAANQRPTSEGIFTGADLVRAVKKGDPSVRDRVFAAGNALMQDWAEAGHKVLGNKLGDSGTATRSTIAALATGGAGIAHPVATALGMGAVGTAYSRPMMAAARLYAGDRSSSVGKLTQSMAKQLARDEKNKAVLRILFPELAINAQQQK